MSEWTEFTKIEITTPPIIPLLGFIGVLVGISWFLITLQLDKLQYYTIVQNVCTEYPFPQPILFPPIIFYCSMRKYYHRMVIL